MNPPPEKAEVASNWLLENMFGTLEVEIKKESKMKLKLIVQFVEYKHYY